MNKETVREKIKILVTKKLITYQDLINITNLTRGTLRYQIYEAKKFDTDLAEMIEKYLNKLGLSATSEGEIMQLGILILELNSSMAQTIQVLSNQIKDSINKKELTEEDKKKIIETLEDSEENLSEEFSNLKRILT